MMARSDYTIVLDMSVADELLPAAIHAVESGEMTLDEAAETLVAFARVVIEE